MKFSRGCKLGVGIIVGVLVFVGVAGYRYSENLSVYKLLTTSGISEAKFNSNIKAAIKNMTLQQKIGQMLMPDYREWKNNSVTAINKDISIQIKKYNLGGVILFRNNFKTETQTKALIKAFQASSTLPLMFGVDQEGGTVTRLPYFPDMPGNMALGATGSAELAEKTGVAIGSELKRLGIQMNFGPDLDVNSNPNNPVIGVRSFGDKPEQVAELGIAYAKGLNEAGVASIGKHFPGHGDLDTDSHLALPILQKTEEQLSALELIPFKAAIDNGIQGIMTAHIALPKIDNSTSISIKDGLPIDIPATLSNKITTGLLRDKLGFNGLIITDAMEMNAVSSHFKLEDAVVRAVNAGADVVLMPEDIGVSYNALIKAVKSGKIKEDRINASVERIIRFKYKYVSKSSVRATKTMNQTEAAKLGKMVASKAITVVNNDGSIPLSTSNKDKIGIIGFNNDDIDNMSNLVEKNSIPTLQIKLDKFGNIDGALTQNQKETLSRLTRVIIITNIADLKNDVWQTKAAQNIISTGVSTIIVSSRNPYLGIDLNGKYAYIAQYSDEVASFSGSCDVIFGKLKATGKLPVSLDK